MLRILADENFNHDVVRGVLRRNPRIDIVCAQNVGLSGAEDPEVLEWAASERRVILTHDVSTMTRYARERVNLGKPMPGVFEVRRSVRFAEIIDDLLLLVECSLDDEWEGQIRYLPFR